MKDCTIEAYALDLRPITQGNGFWSLFWRTSYFNFYDKPRVLTIYSNLYMWENTGPRKQCTAIWNWEIQITVPINPPLPSLHSVDYVPYTIQDQWLWRCSKLIRGYKSLSILCTMFTILNLKSVNKVFGVLDSVARRLVNLN